ncbi:hypothetical protein Poli38472_004701 [Pythium oligandrum]|uniref:Uncharacterized protein n=1 Tax=Pythium oligandrum TaxID=41045 RepID=A0A8K1CAK8_PYTOL|nr:hypothetical protein Poli38472_004701 [Pythium oligandrum]|eukprot:TMW59632.1 hypothetical protein Poli38472_004701 [Pythium oligandrum]
MNELLRRYPDGPECIAYTPGVTPDTGLARHGGSDIDAVVAYMNKIGMPVSTAAYSGAFMARLCVEDLTAAGWKNGMFINVDKPREASAQSNDLALASELWEKSDELLIRKLGA